MNIKKYEAFVRAVERGSLSKAAAELGYTQSGISHMMQSLEDEVGFPLMIRSSAGIVPNEDGQLLLPVIRRLLSTNECLEQSIAKIRGSDIGRIRIASFSSVATYWLPAILADFRKDYPNVEVQIVEGGADRIEEMMASREADLCLYTGGESREFDWFPLHRDELLAIVPPDHPLTRRDTVPVGALMDEPFIMPMAGYDYEVHHILDTLPRYPGIRFSSCSDCVIVSMVAEGLGVSILPELLLRNYRSDAVAMPLAPEQHRVIGMGVPQLRAASPVTRNFMRYVQSYVRERYGEEEL